MGVDDTITDGEIFEFHPPTAVIAAIPDTGVEPLDVQLDASGSTDSDGEIVKYDWDFDGDGTYDLLDGGPIVSHTYDAEGSYAPQVKVTDNDNLTDTAMTAVTVGSLAPPTAVAEATPEAVGSTLAHFDASASFDIDGTVVQYDWDFDDDGSFETMNAGPTPDHDYGAFGTFTANVRATDNDGLFDIATISVTLTEPDNAPPVAAVAPAPAAATAPVDVVWSAAGSTDSDGTIVTYDWDMDNDGTFEILDGGDTQGATYVTGGQMTVVVRVTDDDGATDTETATADINNAPVANLVPVPVAGNAPLNVNWNAAASTDSDGSIVSYDWDMDNDGSFEIIDGGDNQDADYPTAGNFTVGVRVRDDDGATDSTTATTGVNAPPVAAVSPSPPTGTAPLAVTWDASASSDSDGTIEQFDWDMDNNGIFEIIDGGMTQPANYATGGLFTIGVRVTDDDGATGQTTNSIVVNNAPIALVSPSSATGNAPAAIVWDASGSSDSDGTIDQYDWDMDNNGSFEITDGGPTQNANYATGGTFTVGVRVFDNDGASDEATNSVDINNPPIAAVSPSPSGGDAPTQVVWDASASTDSDGTIVQFDWDMDNNGSFEILNGGDTQVGVYADGGLYTVVVRVTDNDGATDTASDTGVYNDPPTAALAANPPSGAKPLAVLWDASASTDSDGTIVQYDWDMDNNGSFEITDGGSTQNANYTDIELVTVRVQVTDNDGAMDFTTATCDVQGIPPVADLQDQSVEGDFAPNFIFWDATGSTDSDGTIVTYDWDMDNNGSFEILNGPDTQMPFYSDAGVYTVRVRVTDDDNLQSIDSASHELFDSPP